MEELVLDVRDLSVALPARAERRYAVADLSFGLRRREILCLVGESGSGKSLTGYALMGLLPRNVTVSGGHALYHGTDLLRLPAADMRAIRGARISMIFQEPMTALNPVWSIGNQMAEVFATHRPMPRAAMRARILDLLTQVQLADPERVARSYPHQISGGQRQRVMIAMALSLDPDILIADEPTTALDVTTEARILDLIRELQRERGMGVLFITHDFGVVSEIADQVVVMRHGQRVEAGPADAVLNKPAHPYTQALLAAVPNLVPPEPAAGGASGDGDAGPACRVRGLEKSFRRRRLIGGSDAVHAVRGVDIDLRRGETLGIVGESGSGKSTVARLIVRLLEPDGGSIDVDGVDLARLSGKSLRAKREAIQIVFQDPYGSLNRRQRVGDIIAQGPINFGVPRAQARARARQLLSRVGLDANAVNRYPSQFSGGQRQRICIARALALNPRILIADEAVSALDVSVQAQVLDLLASLKADFGLSMIFITHDLRVAAQICDRIAVMRGGQVVEIGQTATMFARPEQDYTRTLLASAPGQAWINPRRVTSASTSAQSADAGEIVGTV